MKILFGKESRLKIKQGIDKCIDAVKVSMGHNGKNVLLFNGETTEILNDGVTIARFVESDDEVEMSGIRLAQQCASVTNREAGDGTTTTLVLLQSILNEALDETILEKPRELRKKIQESCDRIVQKLHDASKQVESIKDIENIATTSSLNEKVGKMIAGIFEKLGRNANITIDETRYNVLEATIVDGFQFGSKNVALYSDDKEEYQDITVALFDSRATAKDIAEKAAVVAGNGENQLFVIARDFSKDAIGLITKFKMKGDFTVGAVQNKEINEDDLKALGNKFKRVVVTRENTTLFGGNGDVSEYVKKLQEKQAKEESSFDKEKIDARISKLSSGVAIITVGAQTDVEREELKLKIEDAINASKTAYNYGFVRGGGLALVEAGKGEYLEDVCKAPYKQICQNADVDELEVDDTVVDSLNTIVSALKTAVSVATSILTSEAALIRTEDKNGD